MKSSQPSEPTPIRDDLAVKANHARCPYCHEAVRPGPDEPKRSCEACMAWHHADCWTEQGGCAACDVEDPATVRPAPTGPVERGRRRVSRLAVASLACALLGYAVGLLPWVWVKATAADETRVVQTTTWSNYDAANDRHDHYLEVERADGEVQRFGPEPTPIVREQVAPDPVAAIDLLPFLLLIPLGFELGALVCGVMARRAIGTSRGRLRGQALANAGIGIAGLTLALPCLAGGLRATSTTGVRSSPTAVPLPVVRESSITHHPAQQLNELPAVADLDSQHGAELVTTATGQSAYQLNWIDSDSALVRQLRLRPGDRILAVDDALPLGGSETPLALIVRQLAREAEVSVLIEREGQEHMLSFYTR